MSVSATTAATGLATTITINSFWDVDVVDLATFVVAVCGLVFFAWRNLLFGRQLDKTQKQIDLQTQQRVDDRFRDGIGLLGNERESVRMGAIYVLNQLAIEDEQGKYRKQIIEILCGHVRTHTNLGYYKTVHKDFPSNEIQTALDLLCKNESPLCQIVRHIQTKDRAFRLNFSESYLAGANFRYARLVGANFMFSVCQGATFVEADCLYTRFTYAYCQGADFEGAYIQSASFESVRCQFARFEHAYCQGTSFACSYIQGANFWSSHCQGACFADSYCQEAIFEEAVFTGAVDHVSVSAIESAKGFLEGDVYNALAQTIADNKGRVHNHSLPEGLQASMGSTTPEQRALIKQLKEKINTKEWDDVKQLAEGLENLIKKQRTVTAD